MGRVPVRCAPASAPLPDTLPEHVVVPLPPPHRLKEVVYTLSNHNQNVMAGLWKDLPYKVTKKVKENWVDTLFFLVPVIGTYECVHPLLSCAPRPNWHHSCVLRVLLQTAAWQWHTRHSGARGGGGGKQP